MSLSNLYHEVKKLVGDDNISSSISNLKKMIDLSIDKGASNELTIIQSRWNEIKTAELTNTLSFEELSRHKSMLKHNILQLMDNILDSNNTLPTSLLIKKISQTPKITLFYLRRSTNERFEIEVDPMVPLNKLSEDILLNFHPNYKNDLFFKQGRTSVFLIKILTNKETLRLNMGLNLKSNEVNEGDTIAIDLDVLNIDSILTIVEKNMPKD